MTFCSLSNMPIIQVALVGLSSCFESYDLHCLHYIALYYYTLVILKNYTVAIVFDSSIDELMEMLTFT